MSESDNYRPERMVVTRCPSGLLIGHYLDEPGLIVMERSIGEIHTEARQLLPVLRAEPTPNDTDGMVERREFAAQADRLQAEIDKWKGFPDLIEIPLEMGPSAANRLVRALRIAALTAIHPGLLDGSMVVVPREATREMLLAAEAGSVMLDTLVETTESSLPYWQALAQYHWKMMLAAAHPNITPKPAGPETEHERGGEYSERAR